MTVNDGHACGESNGPVAANLLLRAKVRYHVPVLPKSKPMALPFR